MPKAFELRETMCESSVFIDEGGTLEEVMRDVTRIEVTSTGVVCHGLLGERKAIESVKIVDANLLDHKIILGKIG